MKAATSFARSSRLQALEVAERNALAAGQQRAEALLEELVADQRQRPERDAVEAAVAGDQPRPAGRRARELHRRVDRLGAGAREEHGVEPARQALRERLGEHAGQRRVVDLHAVDQVRGERRLQHLAHVGMVVAEAREALAGVEVEIRAPVGVVEVGALAPRRTRLSKPRMPARRRATDRGGARPARASRSARAIASATTPRESTGTPASALTSRASTFCIG